MWGSILLGPVPPTSPPSPGALAATAARPTDREGAQPMSRRYADQVDVQRQDADPAQFVWHGRLYLVRSVLARWTESGHWWRSAAAAAITNGEATGAPTAALAVVPLKARPRWGESAWLEPLPGVGQPAVAGAVDDGEREFWRVEAAAGRLAGTGVYDLCFDWSRGAWFVARALD
jgi:hypothetical protein